MNLIYISLTILEIYLKDEKKKISSDILDAENWCKTRYDL
jgi:hypothetical protein